MLLDSPGLVLGQTQNWLVGLPCFVLEVEVVQVGQVVALLVVEVVVVVGWVLLPPPLLLALLLLLVGLCVLKLGLQHLLLLVQLFVLHSWPLQLYVGLVFLHAELGPYLFAIGS